MISDGAPNLPIVSALLNSHRKLPRTICVGIGCPFLRGVIRCYKEHILGFYRSWRDRLEAAECCSYLGRLRSVTEVKEGKFQHILCFSYRCNAEYE